MKCGHKGYSVSSLLVLAFPFENFRSRERSNFVDGLIDGSNPLASGTDLEMFLQVPGMGGKVRVFRADTAKSQGLTVGDAGFAMTRVAAG